MKLPPSNGRTLVLAANIRRSDRDHLEPQIQRVFESLAPHVDHAFQIGEVISGLRSRLSRLGDDGAPQGGIIITDESGRVTWTCSQAAMLNGRLFHIDLLGALRFTDEGAQNWALALQRQAGSSRVSPQIGILHDGRPWRIRASLASRDDPTLLHGSPIFPGAVSPVGAARVVFALSPAHHEQTPELLLARRFGLTAAEVSIARLVAAGLSTAEMAEQRQTSVHTVRNQVRAVLDKTESRSRSDIARLLTALFGSGSGS
ncbi:MAG: helix-turn-helix transcriptional regulator [Paracoccus sp. (in: a-proteobacteria)]|uniref:helix-turn-helix transcriptional regulator n=1 Tax=Paracoccus sp. TaxID=267 RepID=UPI0039E5FFA2